MVDSKAVLILIFFSSSSLDRISYLLAHIKSISGLSALFYRNAADPNSSLERATNYITLCDISLGSEPAWNPLDTGYTLAAYPSFLIYIFERWVTERRENKMSASATAKQKVETLLEQLKTYQEKLQRQEQGLRELQSHISQTRTVVSMTIPREIERAHREYISTL